MASVKQFVERRDNIASIVSYVRSVGLATRLEISSALSLSWACVSDLVALLIERNVLTESTQKTERSESEARGRTPTYVKLNGKKYFLGVDINDSGIAITCYSIDGAVRERKKWEAENFDDETALTESVCSKIEEMLLDRVDCCGIGVAMEGMRAGSNSWFYPFATGCESFSPVEVLGKYFGLPVCARHDPECMLYAVANDVETDCMAVRIDNGIGVAAMKSGRILDLPFELGFIRCGGKKLKSILTDAKSSGDYSSFAIELGYAVGNLAMLLGVDRVYIVGEIAEWFDKIENGFKKSFGEVDGRIEYEVRYVTDASEGAARIVASEYPFLEEYKK